jgi:gamma-glutamyltranspeptidase/glutathione hydrolase
MDDFALKPGFPNMYGLTGGDANAIAPGKRMLSSMTPTIVLKNKRLFCVLGTPGGSTIITTVAQVLLNLIDFGMDADAAVAAPRFHHQWLPDRIDYERGAFSAVLIEGLESRGHACMERKNPIGDVQLIVLRDSRMFGVSDPRGGGTPEVAKQSSTHAR